MIRQRYVAQMEQSVEPRLNIVFMGGFTYPRGMAGTRRIQNLIDGLGEMGGVTTRVIIQRQDTRENAMLGVHRGTPYETVMGDVFRGKMVLALPLLTFRTIWALRRAFQPECKNVIYFYGPPFVDSLMPLSVARRMGYKIVFDVVEDFGLGGSVVQSYVKRLRVILLSGLSRRIWRLGAGVIVISSYLRKKCEREAAGQVPMHLMPISVDTDRIVCSASRAESNRRLFYAGSFGRKDGLDVLVAAFEELASRYADLSLVLSGKGDKEAMDEFRRWKEASAYRARIDYRGYLEEWEYDALLREVDIPCVTRRDLGFAHAGFPFKLGEFLATGKPVIASRVSDVEQFLVDRENAMLVKPGSVSDVVAAAEWLLENPNLAAEIGTKGRETAKAYFDQRQQARDLRMFLDAV